jgi:hypothetical protein
MRFALLAVCGLLLSGCATAVAPTARPLTQEHIERIGPTRVVVAENTYGVGKTWFMTDSSAAGASYGLVGALVTVTMDAMINAGPSRRARQAADEINAIAPPSALDASLVAALQRQIPDVQEMASAETVVADAALVADVAVPAADANAGMTAQAPDAQAPAAPPVGVHFTDVSTVQRLSLPGPENDVVEVAATYVLSEDATTLRVIASATYTNVEMPYVTPYTFEREPPRTELEGPVYRNTFVYYSQSLAVPLLTPELKDRLVAAIEQAARDEQGNLPAEGTPEFRSMQRELENARDDELSRPEIAIFLTREWLRDDAAMLQREIEQAHTFIARYVALDLNSTAIPSMEGTDQLLETLDDQRTVRRIGAGLATGSYVSSPGNVDKYSTYGNAVAFARDNLQRAEELRDAARATRRGQ